MCQRHLVSGPLPPRRRRAVTELSTCSRSDGTVVRRRESCAVVLFQRGGWNENESGPQWRAARRRRSNGASSRDRAAEEPWAEKELESEQTRPVAAPATIHSLTAGSGGLNIGCRCPRAAEGPLVLLSSVCHQSAQLLLTRH